MPEVINAPITAEIIGFGRARTGDTAYKLFSVDDELFDYLDVVIKELATFTKCLKETFYVKLIPSQVQYRYVDVADVFPNILQIEEVSIIAPDDTESIPLTFKNKLVFREKRRDNSITIPQYYTYDGVIFEYWFPVQTQGYRLKLPSSRLPLSSEKISRDIDPPVELYTRFLDYLKYGLVVQMALSRPEALGKMVDSYKRLYDGYKDITYIPQTLDFHKTTTTEDF